MAFSELWKMFVNYHYKFTNIFHKTICMVYYDLLKLQRMKQKRGIRQLQIFPSKL